MFGRNTSEDATVVALIAAALRRDIAFGVLTPDERLKIDELRQRYGGSAHSMREALSALSGEGLVEANAQRGFRVASATAADIADIQNLRLEMERIGLSWSMRRGDDEWEGRVIAARHALGKAEARVRTDPLGEALAWDEANRVFRTRLIEACASPRLIAFHARLYDQGRRVHLAALREGRIDFAARAKAADGLVQAVIARDLACGQDWLTQEFDDVAKG